MPDTYAKIQNGVVINIQMCELTDYFDPAYVWVMLEAKQLCVDGTPIQTNCTYDGVDFYAAIEVPPSE